MARSALRILRTRLQAPLALRTLGNLAFRVAGTGASFLVAVLLARLLGQAAYGAYVTWMSATALAATCASLGMPQLVTAELAAARGRGQGLATARGVLRLALLLMGAIAAATLLAGALAGAEALLAAAILACLLLAALVAALQQGFEQVLRSQVAGLLQPVLLVVAVALAGLLAGRALDAQEALLLQLGAVLLSLLLGVLLLVASLGREGCRALLAGAAAWRPGPWLGAGFFLMANQLLVNAQTQLDVLLLGWLRGPEAVAVYHAASRGAYVLTFLFGALTAALSPTVARLHAAGDRAGLAATVGGSAASTLLASAALAFVLALVGPFYLGLYGAGFAAGYPAFLALLLGWLGCVACGPAQTVLLMTGHGKAAALVFAAGTALNLLLGLVLIPLLGALGAALAAAAAVVAVGLAWGALCRRRLGLRVDGLERLRRRPAPVLREALP
jgi:O-antigen/teichoic acid export membrane protein